LLRAPSGDLYTVKLVLGFLVGSFWVVLATLAAEHLGTKVGGIIGGFPSTVAVSLLFLGLVRSPGYVVAATEIFPAASAINGAFIGRRLCVDCG
jgi:hypothetical protein